MLRHQFFATALSFLLSGLAGSARAERPDIGSQD
jgi:hypothetical protein